MPFITADTLVEALERLKAIADHMLKIWFTLKQMGMTATSPAYVDTGSPTPALQRLFSYGDPTGHFFIPFAHTPRYMTMKSDASRSIIQTNIRRWASSGSVVTVDPTNYLQITEGEDQSLEVRPARNYPLRLGFGKNGFALEENGRVTIPLLSFAVWYFRKTDLPNTPDLSSTMVAMLRDDLHLTSAEMSLVFVKDQPDWVPQLQSKPLTDKEIFELVQQQISAGDVVQTTVIQQTFEEYINEVRSMVTLGPGPAWLNVDPEEELQELINAGATAILLYGPPRTGKTRAVDSIVARNDSSRVTIQIHEGWGYDELVIGLRPQEGKWEYLPGPLLTAIREHKSLIVLEEINRTEFSQAIGEVFSLIEQKYRGVANTIKLRDGSDFFIPEGTTLIFTMNTLDRSTEEIDDALLGRVDAVEFPPRVENLNELLQSNQVDDDPAQGLRELFAFIQQYYPLGHGYFAPFIDNTNPIAFYRSRIRPVLQKHLKDYRDNELATIDQKVDQLFA